MWATMNVFYSKFAFIYSAWIIGMDNTLFIRFRKRTESYVCISEPVLCVWWYWLEIEDVDKNVIWTEYGWLLLFMIYFRYVGYVILKFIKSLLSLSVCIYQNDVWLVACYVKSFYDSFHSCSKYYMTYDEMWTSFS